jgi:hypothetical protein
MLIVKNVRGKGRGIFWNNYVVEIEAGELIERCHVVVLSDRKVGEDSEANIYSFEWAKGKSAIALGKMSLCNHSFTPNANYRKAKGMLELFAIRPIFGGQEVTINYNGEPDDMTPMAFTVKP